MTDALPPLLDEGFDGAAGELELPQPTATIANVTGMKGMNKRANFMGSSSTGVKPPKAPEYSRRQCGRENSPKGSALFSGLNLYITAS
jgi:hypothetical protein